MKQSTIFQKQLIKKHSKAKMEEKNTKEKATL